MSCWQEKKPTKSRPRSPYLKTTATEKSRFISVEGSRRQDSDPGFVMPARLALGSPSGSLGHSRAAGLLDGRKHASNGGSGAMLIVECNPNATVLPNHTLGWWQRPDLTEEQWGESQRLAAFPTFFSLGLCRAPEKPQPRVQGSETCLELDILGALADCSGTGWCCSHRIDSTGSEVLRRVV
ncbi:hypothetical protein VTK26DRAFT_5426 [Humicola hyalothermophila]